MKYWPDSKIVKSQNNAFDWQNTAKGIYSKAELASLETNIRQKIGLAIKPSIPTFSRARHEDLKSVAAQAKK
jgi:hypothetical protein